MDESSFDALAAEAATGLKGDRELFLEIKQELQTHLEDKAARFERDGHSKEESVALSKQAFGSPLDMAAELVEANRGRLRLRALLRLGFTALIIPLAVVLALYMGYGRFARFWMQLHSTTAADLSMIKLPTLPLFGITNDPWQQVTSDVRLLRSGDASYGGKVRLCAADLRHYWEAHRSDPDGKSYYAYYTLFFNSAAIFSGSDASSFAPETTTVAVYRQGEQLEPQNALYNIALAEYYLGKGIITQKERAEDREKPAQVAVRDRRAFELGIAELRKALHKPYFHTYRTEMLRKKLQAFPAPRFTEDYLQQYALVQSELYPEYARLRELVRSIPGCVRVLLAEGRRADAEALMDNWKPLSLLVIQDTTDMAPFKAYVARAIASILSKGAGDVYGQLGATAKAAEARGIFNRLEQNYNDWRGISQEVQEHGSVLAYISVWSKTVGCFPSRQELTPGRMHEHVLMEEVAMQGVMLLLVVALLGTVALGGLWLYRLRRAAAIPFLLLPPAKVMLRALLLGIALPMLVYWLYSRCPILGGREFSWLSDMRPRFICELCVLALLMLWLPAQCIRRYLQRRCAELSIALPPRRTGRRINWPLCAAILVTLLLTAVAFFFATEPYVVTGACLLAAGGMHVVLYAARRKRHHEGTLARVVIPIHVGSMLFLTMVLYPWLLYNEAAWLLLLRTVLLGIAIAMWISSVDKNPELAVNSASRLRVISELILLGHLILWLPAQFFRRSVDRRCAALSIMPPSPHEQRLIRWLRATLYTTLLLTVTVLFFTANSASVQEVVQQGIARCTPIFTMMGTYKYQLAGACVFAGIIYAATRNFRRNRHAYALYYGTLARSLAPVYAFSILFLALVVQPWLLYNEATWLRKDTVCFGFLAQRLDSPIGLSSIEVKTTQHLDGLLLATMTARKAK